MRSEWISGWRRRRSESPRIRAGSCGPDRRRSAAIVARSASSRPRNATPMPLSRTARPAVPAAWRCATSAAASSGRSPIGKRDTDSRTDLGRRVDGDEDAADRHVADEAVAANAVDRHHRGHRDRNAQSVARIELVVGRERGRDDEAELGRVVRLAQRPREIAIAQRAELGAIRRRIDDDHRRGAGPELRADAIDQRVEQRERQRSRHDQRADAAALLQREQVRLVGIAGEERVDAALHQPERLRSEPRVVRIEDQRVALVAGRGVRVRRHACGSAIRRGRLRTTRDRARASRPRVPPSPSASKRWRARDVVRPEIQTPRSGAARSSRWAKRAMSSVHAT